MKFEIEQHKTNTDMLTIHIEHPIFDWSWISDNKDICGEDRFLTQQVTNTLGVRRAYFSKYQITIERGRCYEWSDIIDEVMLLVEKWANKKAASNS